MPTNSNTGSSSGNTSSAAGGSQATGQQFKGAMQSTSGQTSKDASAGGENQLDQFISYMKENWKPILTELVTAGVTAYLTHDAKSKAAKRN